EEIHELLLSFAEAGANVVRLKGSDPLVFGRGGEEMDFLQQQGIEVKVIPGITTAELGIPLTHRGVATSVRFSQVYSDLADCCGVPQLAKKLNQVHSVRLKHIDIFRLQFLRE
ncbi:UNVERIFIED_CONTAM: Siroheme synthase, partial [Sesamum radiatum]